MERIYQALESAGWFAGRKTEFQGIPLIESLPKKIKDFYSEFGGLTIKGGCKTILKINNLEYSDIEYYLNLEAELKAPLDLEKDYETYYYSTLLGTTLTVVSIDIQDRADCLLLDKNGRFYYLSTIPQFFWFGDNPIDALSKVLLFGGESAVLDEEALKWNVRKNEESKYQLPINTNLKKNPWF